MQSPALRYSKSLWSYNPIPNGCVFYAPLWSPDMGGVGDSTFKTPDPFGHTCTVSGALQKANGRWFDKIDDVITVPAATSLNNIFDGGGTIMAWINPASDGESDAGRIYFKRGGGVGYFCSVSADDASKVKVYFYFEFSDTDGQWITTATAVTLNTWSLLTLTYNADATANNPIIYVNTTALTVGSGITRSVAPEGTRTDDSAEDLLIGNQDTADATWDGYIGEVLLYNRVLSAVEIAHFYQKTRGRYS